MQPNGTWERWRFVGGAGLLGIAPSADGSMLVCDAYKVCAGACCLRRLDDQIISFVVLVPCRSADWTDQLFLHPCDFFRGY
jgi:hypothetical protein